VFSSNYGLYGDISARIMALLRELCPQVEVYSIDEAFASFELHGGTEAALAFGQRLRQQILQQIGIPVSIGIAPTKTLAKVANHIAKRMPQLAQAEGVCLLHTPAERERLLAQVAVGKIWGIGAALAKRCKAVGLDTALALSKAPEGWAKRELSVVGLRLVRELKGLTCMNLNEGAATRKQHLVSRSFRRDVAEVDQLCEAVATHAFRLGEKLRAQGQKTAELTIFLKRNRFRTDRHAEGYTLQRIITLDVPTSDSTRLIHLATETVRAMCNAYPGATYKKCGLMAAQLHEAQVLQGSLFDHQQHQLERRKEQLMEALDQLNGRMGKNMVRMSIVARPEETATWTMRREHRSPRYTTCWSELLLVKTE
jgi:DNA polymerase V